MYSSSSNNLLLGSSITKSGLHRGPKTRYILYNNTENNLQIRAKKEYINIYNIYITKIKNSNNNNNNNSNSNNNNN